MIGSGEKSVQVPAVHLGWAMFGLLGSGSTTSVPPGITLPRLGMPMFRVPPPGWPSGLDPDPPVPGVVLAREPPPPALQPTAHAPTSAASAHIVLFCIATPPDRVV